MMSRASHAALAGPSEFSRLAERDHAVPRFLLKLYEIVNDPNNEPLVQWSEAGDSFCIFNQDKFARELLGKWFKHQNFSSFVRQLNLYGFRKIAALQQGSMHTNHNDETIQFAHPYFHRGQPDLLALIQRKRHSPTQALAEDGVANLLHASMSQANNEQAQTIDVRSIVEGINAIRRKQQVIASDLSALKRSDDALWKEAIETREKHAKHEDTINRILKFLAGLFGGIMQGNRDKLHAGSGATHSRRLLIENGQPTHADDLEALSDPGNIASKRFATIGTPGAFVASPAPTTNDRTEFIRRSPPVLPFLDPEPPRSSPGPTTFSSLPTAFASAMPTRALEQEEHHADPMWQATLQQFLRSPEQTEDMMETLYAHPPVTTPSAALQPAAPSASAHPSQAQQEQLKHAGLALPDQPYAAPTTPVDVLDVEHANVPGASSQEAALLDNTARIDRAYQDIAGLNADVDDLQVNLHALIHDMGLDPFLNSTASAGGGGQPGEDISLDSWLNQLETAGTAGLAYPSSPTQPDSALVPGEDFSAFFDTAAFEDQPSSVASLTGTAPVQSAGTSPSGVKRKLETIDTPAAPEAPSCKKKR